MPRYRTGLGDETGRAVRSDHGQLEYRFAPGGTCEIVNIEVEAGQRRRGEGRRLLELLRAELPRETLIVYAITRVDNVAAQQFYEALGFRLGGRLHNFYRSRQEGFSSALLYVLEI